MHTRSVELVAAPCYRRGKVWCGDFDAKHTTRLDFQSVRVHLSPSGVNMAFAAKYRSRCPSCHRSIEVGQEIEAERGQKARHADCTQNAKDEAATQRTVAYVAEMGKWLRENPEPTASRFAIEHGAPPVDLDGCLTSEERRMAESTHAKRSEAWLKVKRIWSVFETEHAVWEHKRAKVETAFQAMTRKAK